MAARALYHIRFVLVGAQAIVIEHKLRYCYRRGGAAEFRLQGFKANHKNWKFRTAVQAFYEGELRKVTDISALMWTNTLFESPGKSPQHIRMR